MSRSLIVLAALLVAGLGLKTNAQVGTGGNGYMPGLGNEPWIVSPGTAESDEDSGILFGDRPGELLVSPNLRDGKQPVLPPREPFFDPQMRMIPPTRRN